MSISLKKYSVLVVDDDPDILTAVRLLLKPEVREVVVEKRPDNIPSLLAKTAFDVILLDMNFNSTVNTGNEGIYWLRKIKVTHPKANIIMITAYGDIDVAVTSLKEGASDFVVKPWNNRKLLEAIENSLVNKPGEHKERKNVGGTEIIGACELMTDLFHKINKVAVTDANVLILGENGTGKDLVARVIHEKSLRAQKPFVKIDLGALAGTLFESELFGHKKGSFTDAREDRKGMFEAADQGTMFLDEIGNITLQQQSKLLTVLQNRQIIRLGSNQPIPVDIRLLCATNVGIKELSNENHFRRDLIYRINTVEITVPPLRKRGSDIALLSKHFAQVYGSKYLKPEIGFTNAAMTKLNGYSFPGNVRELQYVIERAVIMAEDNVLDAGDILFSPLETVSPNDEPDELKLNTIEKNTILRVLEKNSGNISKAAKELGITRTALYRRLNKHEI